VSKRSVANDIGNGMSLSREIIVLDFGDEATSPYDFDRTTKRPGGNNTDYKVYAVDWPSTVEEVFATTAESCPTKTSVLVLSVICALLLIIYMCTMFYFCVRKVILQNQKEREVRTTTIFRG
jgi:hypothetical protein